MVGNCGNEKGGTESILSDFAPDIAAWLSGLATERPPCPGRSLYIPLTNLISMFHIDVAD